MGDPLNPLLPTGSDIAWTALVILPIALVVVALVSIAQTAQRLTSTAQRLTSTQALVWSLVTIFVPVVGPLAWLSIGRRSGLAPVQPRVDL